MEEKPPAPAPISDQSDAWFYTLNGEQHGPVAKSHLAILAEQGSLHPRQDMVWKSGMNEWQPAGEIEGLFKRREIVLPPPSAAATAPAANPYSPPGHRSIHDSMRQLGDWPGARRRSYILVTIVFALLWAFGIGLATPFLIQTFGEKMVNQVLPFNFVVPFLVSIYVTLQRFTNLGMSRWWILGNFVPVLNFWVGYRLFACPAGFALHKKLDGKGIFLAIIYWLMIAFVILTILAVIALLSNLIGSPELQEEIRKIIEQAQRAQR
ncbi:MAG: DUF4339 domain-containing protein [Verrucomicrobia bacterium]|nr:MAG: DUF4339 domain-containing protein [Verrucomicrobiota bacterium]